MALLVGGAGWLVGLWYGWRWDSPSPLYVLGALGSLGALLLGRSDRRLTLFAVFVLALTLGAGRM
ncbi:MAG: M48 family peptidase, partial [Chloroflexota bacterium]|nr:M48 family peptidase [Chloroflexota bacterium]